MLEEYVEYHLEKNDERKASQSLKGPAPTAVASVFGQRAVFNVACYLTRRAQVEIFFDAVAPPREHPNNQEETNPDP